MLFEVVHDISENHPGLPEFQQVADQREHDPHVPSDGRSQYCSQLGLEQGDIAKREPHTAKPQLGVDHLRHQFPGRFGNLVRSDVQRADRHRVIWIGGNHLAVGLVVVVLSGDLVLFQVQELGAVQPDSPRTAITTDGGFLGKLDISQQGDGFAVECFSRECLE